MDSKANVRRLAAIDAMHRFAFDHRLNAPVVREEWRDGYICFIGKGQNGREYAVGYEPDPGEGLSGADFPPAPDRWKVPPT